MAELTKIEAKLGEVLGLAQAAQGATTKVERLIDDREIARALSSMREEAAETERRCVDLAGSLEGRKTAILEKGRETKSEAKAMMATYLGEDAEGLDGLEFLTMAEAGEVGHWEILGKLAERAGDVRFRELARWATPIQKSHLAQVRQGSLEVAGREDPSEPA